MPVYDDNLETSEVSMRKYSISIYWLNNIISAYTYNRLYLSDAFAKLLNFVKNNNTEYGAFDYLSKL